ncbi:hypothetical protein C1646_767534 [Rhizophagus diaphanus]|nr:hypothetical protein C1646_767534 [Rhizophagus diaphanus] [Rhizophagus sp. MUCL 43196]
MDNRERKDTIHKGKCRDIVDRIIESIKYSQRPTMREKGLRIIIVVIVRDCIEGNLENEVCDKLIGNPELIRYGYILEDWDIENRFQKFWEWYDTILEIGMKADYIDDRNVAKVMTEFRKLLYMEERIAEDTQEIDRTIVTITNLIKYKHPVDTNRSWEELTSVWDRYVQKIKQRFIDTRQFTKEPEDSESDEAENSPESYEFEEAASDGYEIIEEDGIEWSVELLKKRIEDMGGELTDEDIQRIWNLRIRMELVLTEDFLGTFFERKNLSDEKLKDEMKDWTM